MPTSIYEKLDSLEKELQRLKLEAYFKMSSKKKASVYPESLILRSLKKTRDEIWQKRYAKKVSRIS